MTTILVRASRRMLLVRFGDDWYCYYSWQDLLKDLNPSDTLRIQAVKEIK